MKTFRGDLVKFRDKIEAQVNFSFSKYSDGEYAILKNVELTNCDGWTYTPKDSFYHEKLLESYQYQDPNYLVGVGCVCCNGQAMTEDMKELSKQKEENLTWANLLVNGNYKFFLNEVVPLFTERPIYLVANERSSLDRLPFKVKRHYTIGDLAWKDDYKLITTIKNDIDSEEINNSIFLFCAGPLGNMLAHQLWEDNKTNTYLDIGSTLNPQLGAGKNRGYLEGYSTINQVCI